MLTLILDDELAESIRAQRAACGGDHHDEVWEGVYRMAPMPNDEHQEIVHQFAHIFEVVLGSGKRARIRPGVNISDRVEDWEHNFRCPDVVVFLKECSAVNHGAFWHGGPDFAVEVISPRDDSRAKIPFYAKVGTRELLLVDRDPWSLELWRLESDVMTLASRSEPEKGETVSSQVLPFTFRLVTGSVRPEIEVQSTETGKVWMI